MRVLQEVLSPGVQNAEESDLGSEMLRIAGDGEQGFGGRAEENTVHNLLVVKGDSGYLFRQREDHMKVLDRQQFFLPVSQPACPLGVLALRAVPVATGVVSDPGKLTLTAGFGMPSQHGGAAGFDRTHHTQLLPRQSTLAAVSLTVLPKNAGQLASRPGHARGSYGDARVSVALRPAECPAGRQWRRDARE